MTQMTRSNEPGALLVVSDEVRTAIDEGRPVVALESSLIAQGLPAPLNLETAYGSEAAVREEGAVPATTAVDAGRLVVGAPKSLLERLADPENHPAKGASRDFGPLLASGRLASTTVSAVLRLASWAGIRLVATGGIGGVHRGASLTFDISSDIDEMAATPVAVVSSGAKSILDLPATLEMLETRRVPVVGLGVTEFPAFYTASSGLVVPHSVPDAAAAAAAIDAHLALPGAAGILIVQPPPADVALNPLEVGRWIRQAVADADRNGVSGGRVTPFLLARIVELSEGRTLRTNVALIVNNARTAARIAVARAHHE